MEKKQIHRYEQIEVVFDNSAGGAPADKEIVIDHETTKGHKKLIGIFFMFNFSNKVELTDDIRIGTTEIVPKKFPVFMFQATTNTDPNTRFFEANHDADGKKITTKMKYTGVPANTTYSGFFLLKFEADE